MPCILRLYFLLSAANNAGYTAFTGIPVCRLPALPDACRLYILTRLQRLLPPPAMPSLTGRVGRWDDLLPPRWLRAALLCHTVGSRACWMLPVAGLFRTATYACLGLSAPGTRHDFVPARVSPADTTAPAPAATAPFCICAFRRRRIPAEHKLLSLPGGFAPVLAPCACTCRTSSTCRSFVHFAAHTLRAVQRSGTPAVTAPLLHRRTPHTYRFSPAFPCDGGAVAPGSPPAPLLDSLVLHGCGRLMPILATCCYRMPLPASPPAPYHPALPTALCTNCAPPA